MPWKNFGETTEEVHTIFFIEKEDKHERGVGFLVHKDTVNTSSSLQQAVPSNITVAQAYTPKAKEYDDNKLFL